MKYSELLPVGAAGAYCKRLVQELLHWDRELEVVMLALENVWSAACSYAAHCREGEVVWVQCSNIYHRHTRLCGHRPQV